MPLEKKGNSMTRTFRLGLFLLAASFCAEAQVPDNLPVSPAYKGEIRRGADGRLTVLDTAEPVQSASVGTPRPATMFVGDQEKITTITEAANRARDGEVIEIRPGDYRGQPAVWTQRDLIIRGAGVRPVMIADGKNAEGKAIWVVRGGNVQIENIEFRGARVPSGNGAGIRFEAGHLVVRRCAFYDNEMGILTANTAEMTLEVSDSVFAAAPHHAGRTGLRQADASIAYPGKAISSVCYPGFPYSEGGCGAGRDTRCRRTPDSHALPG